MVVNHEHQFNLFPSHLGLRKYIQYYNILFPSKDTFTARYTLMPDACGTLSLAFDGTYVKAELWGAYLNPIVLGLEPNQYEVLLLIRLSPIGLYQITRQNQDAFADQRFPLSDIDNELFHSLHQAFASSHTVTDVINACETILYKRMEKPVVSDALLLATKAIFEQHGQVEVKEIARQCCYSDRHLNRLFRAQIGMNLKNYARLTRFHYVLKHMQTSPCVFATLSQQAGYFDQAHFDKDFKAISGVTPQTYLKTMSDFYYDELERYDTMSSKED